MIHPLFKHFGSKWSSSKHYPPPRHPSIYEPYAGSAGYSLRYNEKRVIIWEDDLNLAALWIWLIGEATEEDVRNIPVGLPVGTDIRKMGCHLTYGQMLLLKHWQRTNNCGDCWTISPWGNKPGQWTANTRARVAEEIDGIKHWTFAKLRYDQPDVTYFIDPPYQYNYRYRFKGFDYEMLKLSASCVPETSQLIVCEATCPKTGAVPTYLPFAPSHRQVTSRRKSTQNHHSQELIYTR